MHSKDEKIEVAALDVDVDVVEKYRDFIHLLVEADIEEETRKKVWAEALSLKKKYGDLLEGLSSDLEDSESKIKITENYIIAKDRLLDYIKDKSYEYGFIKDLDDIKSDIECDNIINMADEEMSKYSLEIDVDALEKISLSKDEESANKVLTFESPNVKTTIEDSDSKTVITTTKIKDNKKFKTTIKSGSGAFSSSVEVTEEEVTEEEVTEEEVITENLKNVLKMTEEGFPREIKDLIEENPFFYSSKDGGEWDLRYNVIQKDDGEIKLLRINNQGETEEAPSDVYKEFLNFAASEYIDDEEKTIIYLSKDGKIKRGYHLYTDDINETIILCLTTDKRLIVVKEIYVNLDDFFASVYVEASNDDGTVNNEYAQSQHDFDRVIYEYLEYLNKDEMPMEEFIETNASILGGVAALAGDRYYKKTKHPSDPVEDSYEEDSYEEDSYEEDSYEEDSYEEDSCEEDIVPENLKIKASGTMSLKNRDDISKARMSVGSPDIEIITKKYKAYDIKRHNKFIAYISSTEGYVDGKKKVYIGQEIENKNEYDDYNIVVRPLNSLLKDITIKDSDVVIELTNYLQMFTNENTAKYVVDLINIINIHN